jgi:23S rRNA pseudouridine955/2504/2580 synthase
LGVEKFRVKSLERDKTPPGVFDQLCGVFIHQFLSYRKPLLIVKPYPPEAKRTSVRQVVISHREAGMRLDRFLKDNLPDAPISLIQKLLRTGQVRVDSKRKKGNYRLVDGELVRIPPINIEPASDHGAGGSAKKCPAGAVADIGRRILYRDSTVLVVDKPAGMAVHSGSGQSWGVVDALRQYMAGEDGVDADINPELCHRLDRDTSGCLLFGLGKYATRTLTAAFRDGTIHKGYLALVKGRVSPATGLIDKPLIKGVVRGGERMVVTGNNGEGQEARTRYRTEKNFAGATLLDITLETGRTHQIRAHFLSIGHPVAQDPKYGDREFNQQMKKNGLPRLFLHAGQLVFSHPETNEKIEITAPLDRALKTFLDKL